MCCAPCGTQLHPPLAELSALIEVWTRLAMLTWTLHATRHADLMLLTFSEVCRSCLQAQHAEQQLAQKLNDTKQFQQMRRLMQHKSQEVTRLRKQLAAYEPQLVTDADASY